MGLAASKGRGVKRKNPTFLRSFRVCLFSLLLLCPALPHALAVSPREVPPTRVNIGKLRYGGGGDWYANPSSLPNLLAALRDWLKLDTPLDPVEVQPLDDTLFSLPLVYFTGHGNVRFTPAERENLRRYVSQGGIIWADDNYGMDKSLRREVAALFPGEKLVPLPFDHPLYHTVYPFRQGPPKVHQHDGKPPQSLAVVREGRVVFLYTYECDIGDGMEDLSVHNVSPGLHQAALRFGVNVVVYALSY